MLVSQAALDKLSKEYDVQLTVASLHQFLQLLVLKQRVEWYNNGAESEGSDWLLVLDLGCGSTATLSHDRIDLNEAQEGVDIGQL